MEKGLEKAGWSASTLCRNDNNEKQERRTWNRITECETRSRKVSWSDGDLPYGEILSSENIIIYEIR